MLIDWASHIHEEKTNKTINIIMQSFTQWLEANHDIRLLSYDKTGDISFYVNGRIYKYNIDAALFYNKGKFRAWMRYAPGRALNYVKKYGQLISPLQKKEAPSFDGACPECGAHAESYQDGVVPCPNCGYSPN